MDDQRNAQVLDGPVEGIETPGQLDMVMAEGAVTEAQGFLLSPAIPAREIKMLLEAGTIRKKMAA